MFSSGRLDEALQRLVHLALELVPGPLIPRDDDRDHRDRHGRPGEQAHPRAQAHCWGSRSE